MTRSWIALVAVAACGGGESHVPPPQPAKPVAAPTTPAFGTRACGLGSYAPRVGIR